MSQYKKGVNKSVIGIVISLVLVIGLVILLFAIQPATTGQGAANPGFCAFDGYDYLINSDLCEYGKLVSCDQSGANNNRVIGLWACRNGAWVKEGIDCSTQADGTINKDQKYVCENKLGVRCDHLTDKKTVAGAKCENGKWTKVPTQQKSQNNAPSNNNLFPNQQPGQPVAAGNVGPILGNVKIDPNQAFKPVSIPNKACAIPTLVNLDAKNLFHYTLTPSSCFINVQNSVQEAKICGTSYIANELQLCHKQQGKQEFIRVPFIDQLYLTNQRPSPINTIGTTEIVPLFSKKDEIDLFYVPKVTTTAISFDLTHFAKSFATGQKLLLKVDTEYYLLTHPKEPISRKKFQLLHVPTQDTFPVTEVITSGGAPAAQFTLKGQKTMQLVFGKDILNIILTTQTDAPQGYLEPKNLEQEYEVTFTKKQPVEITGLNSLEKLTICVDDQEGDRVTARVCQNGNELVALKEGELKKVVNPLDPQKTPYAFLYTFDKEKKVSVFLLKTLSGSSTPLPHKETVVNLNAGRRIAIEPFNDKLYLLEQPKASILDLEKTKLVHYDGTTTPFSATASGSQDKVEYGIANKGTVYLQRNYGSPTPPFEIYSLTKEQIASKDIDLDKSLFTSFTSGVPVKIVQPVNFGSIARGTRDSLQFKQTFIIESQQAINQQKEHTLSFDVPKAIGNTLFHYHAAQIANGVVVKTTAVYRLYDLDANVAGVETRIFNDQFINNFTQGNNFALKFNNKFYLVTYQKDNQPLQLFDLAKVQLKQLGASTLTSGKIESNTATFGVEGGDIRITVTPTAISFARLTQKQLNTKSFSDFYAQILPANTLTLEGSTFAFCFDQLYQATPTTAICENGNTQNPILIKEPTVRTLNGKEYLFSPNGLLNDKKALAVQRIFPIDQNTPYNNKDWFAFVTQVRDSKGPLFKVANVLYQTQASGTSLDSFSLKPIKEQETIIAKTQKVSDVVQNGSFELGNTLLQVKQALTNVEKAPLEVTFSVLPEYLVSSKVTSLKAQRAPAVAQLLNFVTKAGGKTYTIETKLAAPLLQWVFVKEQNKVILGKQFVKGEQRTIYLDNEPVQVTLNNLTTVDAEIILERK